MVRVIDLRSDTVTKPTPAMRKAMAEAVVGDDVYREDPTVLELENIACQLFDKEAALYFPTGTMGNLASVMSHCWERGQEVLLGDACHIHMYEQGGIAQLAGVHPRTLHTLQDGTFDFDEIESKIQPDSIHSARTALLCLENTHNRCGGVVLTPDYIEKVAQIVKPRGIKVHMDGARIMNASVKLGIPASVILKHCDSVSVCLSKGLGAPAGTIVAGSKEFINRALRCRKVLGGGMRQSGVIAAAGIISLTQMVDRLKEDHDHATQIAQAIKKLNSPVVSVNMDIVQTNMVMLDINPKYATARQFCDRLLQVAEGEKKEMGEDTVLKMNPFSPTRIRCVLHADISSDDVLLAISKLEYVINEFADKKNNAN